MIKAKKKIKIILIILLSLISIVLLTTKSEAAWAGAGYSFRTYNGIFVLKSSNRNRCPYCGKSGVGGIVTLNLSSHPMSVSIPATCTLAGGKATLYCHWETSTGNYGYWYVINSGAEIAALGHDYSTTKKATCTEAGSLKCSRCSSTVTLTKLGHDYKTIDIVYPNCTKDGYILQECSRCRNLYKYLPGSAQGSSFTKLGHKFEYKDTQPTCTTGGYRTNTCTRTGCGYSYKSSLPYGANAALGHNWQTTSDVKPTCTEPGYVIQTCSRCKAERNATPGSAQGSTYAALGHNYVNGTCTRCGLTYGQAGNTGTNTHVHTWVDATCTTPERCTTCNQTSGSALGHNYVSGKCIKCGEVAPTAPAEQKQEETPTTQDTNILGSWNLTGNGYCSGTAKATLYKDGLLEISGEGSVYNYKSPSSTDTTDTRLLSPITNKSSVKKVHITGKVNDIGTYLFYYFVNLEEIVIDHPETINYIGEGAFFGCKNLKSFTMPPNVTQIGARTFCHCHSLTSIDLSKNANFVRIGHEAFRDCWSLKKVKLPEGLKVIGYGAFYNCIALQNVILPSTITAMGTKAVENDETGLGNSSQLTDEEKKVDNIEGYNNVFTINFARNAGQEKEYSSYVELALKENNIDLEGKTPQENINKLLTTKVWYYNQNQVLSNYASHKASNELTISPFEWDLSEKQDKSIIATLDLNGHMTITGTGKMKDYGNSESPWNAVRTMIKSVSIGEGITTIGEHLFYWNTNLKTVSLPSTLKEIHYGAFFGCYILEGITLPDTVEKIGGYAFCHCHYITNITVPSEVVALDEGIFRDCWRLKTVTIKGEVTEIGKQAFFNCPNLEDFTIPMSIKSVGEKAFKTDFSVNADTIHDEFINVGPKPVKYYQDDNVMKNYVSLYSTDRTFTQIAVQKIENQTNIEDMQYELGDDLQVDDLKILVTYADGKTKTLYSQDVTVSPKKADKAGTQKVTITYCGSQAEFNVEVHQFATEFTVDNEATCEHAGQKSKHCLVDGCDAKKEVTEIPQENHAYDEGIETKLTTCTEAGEMRYTCTKCGATKTETIPATGHDYDTEFIVDKEATCKEAGSKSRHCKNCDSAIDETEIAKTSHTYDEGKVTKAATCKEAGEKTYTCTVCGATKTETIPATGHDYNNGKCKNCGEDDPNYKETEEKMEINSVKYEILDVYLTKIQPKTTVKTLLDNLNTNATVKKVYNTEGEELEETDYVGTEMTLKLSLGSKKATYTLVVIGDATGDGQADFNDIVSINRHRLGKKTLSEVYVLAGDVDGDSEAGFKDIVKINKYRLNKITEL